MKVLMFGGTSESKSAKINNDFIAECKKLGMSKIEVVTANMFTNDLKELEAAHNPDIIVRLATKTLDTSLPIVDGMPLVYAFMGPAKVYDEVQKYYTA